MIKPKFREEERVKYSYKVSGENAGSFQLFVRGCLDLIKDPKYKFLRIHLRRKSNSGDFYDDSIEYTVEEEISAHGKVWKLEEQINHHHTSTGSFKGESLVEFFQGCLSKKVRYLDRNHLMLVIESVGSIEYCDKGPIRDSLVFVGLGDLRINPRKQLDDLKKHFRLK